MTETPDPNEAPSAAFTTTDVRTLLGIITEEEFGRAIGVVGPTIAGWRNKGEGPPFFRFRRNIFYRTADAVQWIIENTRDPITDEFLVPKPQPAELLGQLPKPPPIKSKRNTRGDGTLELTGADIDAVNHTSTSTLPQEEPAGGPGAREPSAV